MYEDNLKSPGGYVMFGLQGWMWGPPRPTSITFFLDNTAKVCDQYGRPIKGAIIEGKEVHFAQEGPTSDTRPGSRKHLATHAHVIAALHHERVDWQTLTYAGWPQVPYEELKKLKQVPPTPAEELIKIKDPVLRRDAIKLRNEVDAERDRERAEAGLPPEGYLEE